MARQDITRLPDFLIIGAAKAGTTSTHFYLSQHPEISMSWPKETNFFTRPDHMNDIDWYMSCFSDQGSICGEASPKYAMFPRCKHVPQRIHALVPDVKLIFLVRDPIQRAESHYYHRYFKRTEYRSIDDVFADDDILDDALIVASKYGMQLEQYLAYFPLSQTMIVDSLDLRDARTSTLRSMFSFLEVDADFSSKAFGRQIKDRNKTVRLSRTAARLHGSAPAQLGRRAIPASVREPLYATARRVLSPTRTDTSARLSPEMREQVAGYFAEDVALLRELTGRPFAHWSV